jgi:hypothetical protein
MVHLRNAVVALAAAALLAAFGTPAQALTLADLAVGGSFSSLDGRITFSNFDVTVTGSLSTDLDDYAVAALGDGFRIVGAIAAADGNVGSIQLSFEAETVNVGDAISGASLAGNPFALGEAGALAAVNEQIFGPPGFGGADVLAALGVVATSGGLLDVFDSAAFAPQTRVGVSKGILVLASGESAAMLSQVDQRFAVVVPEPGMMVLGALGLLGLATFQGKRPSRRG